jgi:hypothetical protein
MRWVSGTFEGIQFIAGAPNGSISPEVFGKLAPRAESGPPKCVDWRASVFALNARLPFLPGLPR